MTEHKCRACSGKSGHVVLDLGKQPACDHFPKWDDPGPDPVYPLQMWLCSGCGLAQLLDDPTVPEEPRGTEPAALVAQARDAVGRVAASGLLPPGARIAEYGSPHGGSWLGLLAERGLIPVSGSSGGSGSSGALGSSGAPGSSGGSWSSGSGEADVILDCFGLMHAPDQASAMAERAARLAPGGVLLLQYHSLHTILAQGQWNALRHGHYAYYSTIALTKLLLSAGLAPRTSWRFDLYGGTILLAARRSADCRGDRSEGGQGDGCSGDRQSGWGRWADCRWADCGRCGEPDESVMVLLAAEAGARVRDPEAVRALQRNASSRATALRDWLTAMRAAGRTVLGYSAASRAVALLRMADIDRDLLPAVADASPAKQGLRMPGTGIEIIGPPDLIARRPDAVLLFVPDLLPELQATYPEVEASGTHWINPDALPCPLPLRASGLRGFQQDAEAGQAAASGGADAADREA